MKTLPCGHCVVCRKCFVKTIQTAVTERCLPLRCVVCRTKILKLKQQPLTSSTTTTGTTFGVRSRCHTAARAGHHQTSIGSSTLHGRHADPGETSQRSRPSTTVTGGPTSKGGLLCSLGTSYGRAPPATTTGTHSGTSRLPRPMHPLLIYPSEASGERSWPGPGAGASIGWSENSTSVTQSTFASRGSPLTVLPSSRRRVRHLTAWCPSNATHATYAMQRNVTGAKTSSILAF